MAQLCTQKKGHTQNIRNRGITLDQKQYSLSKIEEVLAVVFSFLAKRLFSY
jgi:hypothetical protein